MAYLLFGGLAFGLNVGGANYSGALIILVLTIICCSSVGILSASFIMVLKKRRPNKLDFQQPFVFIECCILSGGHFAQLASEDILSDTCYTFAKRNEDGPA
jgi:hypothetical protein